MNCPTCSAPIAADDRRCPACGASAPGPSPHAAPVGGPPPAPRAAVSAEASNWAVGAHLAGLGLGVVTVATIGFLAPLMVWLIKRDEHPFIEHHAKEALNFQLTVLTAVIAAVVLAIPALIVGVLTLGVALIVLALVGVAALVLWFVLPIIAAVKAANGEGYRYPVTIRYVR